MKTWFDRLLLLGITVLVLVLAITASPMLFGGHMSGMWLLAHMMVSGALVFLLPVLALTWTWRNISRFKSGLLQRLGYWSLIVTGFLTIGTMFVCMLPFPSTDQIHQLIAWHGYAGFAMLPAIAALLIGTWRWRNRIADILSLIHI